MRWLGDGRWEEERICRVSWRVALFTILRSLSFIALIDGFERYLHNFFNAFQACAIEVTLFSIPNGKHLPIEVAKHARYKDACTHILTPQQRCSNMTSFSGNITGSKSHRATVSCDSLRGLPNEHWQQAVDRSELSDGDSSHLVYIRS